MVPSRDFKIIKPIHSQVTNCVQDTSITVQEHENEQVNIDKKEDKDREEKFT